MKKSLCIKRPLKLLFGISLFLVLTGFKWDRSIGTTETPEDWRPSWEIENERKHDLYSSSKRKVNKKEKEVNKREKEVEKALSVSETILAGGSATLGLVSFLKTYGNLSKHLMYYQAANKASNTTRGFQKNVSISSKNLELYLNRSFLKRAIAWAAIGTASTGFSIFLLSSDADASTMDDYYSSEEGFQEFQELPIEEKEDIIRNHHSFRENLLALGDKMKEHIDWELMSKEERNEYIRKSIEDMPTPQSM